VPSPTQKSKRSEHAAAHGSPTSTPAPAGSPHERTNTFPPLVKGGPGWVGPVPSPAQPSKASEDGAANGSPPSMPPLAESTPARTITFPPLVKGGPGGVGRTAWLTGRMSVAGTIDSAQSGVGSKGEHPGPRVVPPLLEGGLGGVDSAEPGTMPTQRGGVDPVEPGKMPTQGGGLGSASCSASSGSIASLSTRKST
jgi:hypothetical protein